MARELDGKPRGVPPPPQNHRLHLFVAGEEPNSRRAKENLHLICSQHLPGDCELEITDVLQDFRRALDHGIFITPALIVRDGERMVTIFGNLSDTAVVLAALGLEERQNVSDATQL